MLFLCATCGFNQRVAQLYDQLLVLKHEFRKVLLIIGLFLVDCLCLSPEILGFRTKTLYAFKSQKNGIGRVHKTSSRRDSVLHKIGHIPLKCINLLSQ
jgi:hypothetical protein